MTPVTRNRVVIGATAVLVFGAAIIIAAIVSDAISTDDEFVLDEPGEAIPLVGLTASSAPDGAPLADSVAAPGAVVAAVAVPLPPPLLPDTPPVDAVGVVDSSAADSTEPAVATVAEPVTSSAPGLPTSTTVEERVTSSSPTLPATTTAVPAPTSPATTPGPGGAPTVDDPATTAPDVGTIYRFFDLCADRLVQECPLGVGGTVLFAGGSAPPPPVAIDIITDPAPAIRDQIRCELSWPSSTSIPVLVMSNRPLDVSHATLSVGNVIKVDEVLNQRTTPSEIAWYEQRVAAGTPVGTAVGDGVHSCLEFDLEGPGAPAGLDRNGRVRAEVTAFAGSSTATLVRDFDGEFRAGKPPVQIIPVDGYRAVVVIPQRKDDTVNATLFASWQSVGWPGTGPCPANDRPGESGFLTPRSPATGPKEASAVQLSAPGYPFDRAYTHYTVWDLYLRSGTDYTLCVAWQLDDAREHWSVETPAAWRVNVSGRVLGYNSQVDEGSLLLRMPGIQDCFVANPGQFSFGGRDLFPEQTLYHSGGWETWPLPDPSICASRGWRVPETIEIEARLSAPGDETLYGIARVPFGVLLDTCVFRSPSGSVTSGCDGPTVEWRIKRVLCGGPIAIGSCGSPDRTLTTEIRLSPDQNNSWSDPKSWAISQVLVADLSDPVTSADRVDPPPP